MELALNFNASSILLYLGYKSWGMHMKRSDIWWAVAYGLLAVFTVLFCVTGGFAQFAVYATAGELLSGRMLEGTWQINRATWFKSLSWGIGGVLVTLAFTVFSQGTRQAMAAGLLPGYGNALAQAFFTSLTNNLFFAPIHSALMRVCGNYAEIRFLAGQHITPRQAVDSVDWGELIDFTLFKTIPLFWIPVNTVGFLLPQEYRIVFAAVLSLAFGILMTVLKLRERKNRSRKESPI